jgi:hypothetical protein
LLSGLRSARAGGGTIIVYGAIGSGGSASFAEVDTIIIDEAGLSICQAAVAGGGTISVTLAVLSAVQASLAGVGTISVYSAFRARDGIQRIPIEAGIGTISAGKAVFSVLKTTDAFITILVGDTSFPNSWTGIAY